MLEKEGAKEEAIMFYEQAADLFATENSSSEANKCNLKARWWGQRGRWEPPRRPPGRRPSAGACARRPPDLGS